MPHMSEEEFAIRFPEAAKAHGSVSKARTGVADALAKEEARQKREALENALAFALTLTLKGSGIEFVRQYKFAEDRAFRFDFAFPEHRLAIEVQGGTWINGGHNRGRGAHRDMEKKRLAISMGWRVLEFGTDDMKNPVGVAEQVLKILNGNPA